LFHDTVPSNLCEGCFYHAKTSIPGLEYSLALIIEEGRNKYQVHATNVVFLLPKVGLSSAYILQDCHLHNTPKSNLSCSLPSGVVIEAC